MAIIKELDPQLANQIAAGEVVERPASVVKELVENAIDAGSDKIEIFIEEAGLKRIEIIDNGTGISSDDVANALKRHATSKIHSREDLFRIRTLGFRGEALPSIASVTKMTIETSTGSEIGSYLYAEGGKIIEEKPFSMRKGTKIVVEDLFYNTPARLKYVKTLHTELANIGDIINRLAMSHPDVAFRLVHDGNRMLQTTGNGELKQTLAGIYGVANAKKMLKIKNKNLDFSISGYISLPELTRASRNYLSLIVNGRYIRNFLLNKAIVEGYGSKLMVGRFPIAVIEIKMDPLLVDVNVHPTKQEVRISKEQELQDLIKSAIQTVLSEQELIPSAAANLAFKQKSKKASEQTQLTFDTISATQQQNTSTPHTQTNSNLNKVNHTEEDRNFKRSSLAYDAISGTFYDTKQVTHSAETAEKTKSVDQSPYQNKEQKQATKSSSLYLSTDKQQAMIEEQATELSNKGLNSILFNQVSGFQSLSGNSLDPKDFIDPFGRIAKKNNLIKSAPLDNSDNENIIRTSESAQVNIHEDTSKDFSEIIEKVPMETKENSKVSPTKHFPTLEYFGQMHGTYLFAQSEQGLYIIDQHAAQERIKYEYFRKNIGEVADAMQELLVPIVLEYSSSDVIRIEEQKEKLDLLGIKLESFGLNSYVIRAHPTWYPKGEEESTIREMIDLILSDERVSVAKFREDLAIMMSCKKSIKANHHLDDRQARALLVDLAKCENPFNCPHGRPVLVQFSNYDMERMFKRIQDPH